MIKVLLSADGKVENAKWYELGSFIDVDDILDELCGMEVDEDGDETGDRNDDSMVTVHEIEEDDFYTDLSNRLEGMSLTDLQEFAEFWDGLDSGDQRIFMAICEVGYSNIDSNVDVYNNGNYSYYDEKNFYDLGYEVYNSMYGMDSIPSALQCHIDWESYGRDLGYSETDYGFIELF